MMEDTYGHTPAKKAFQLGDVYGVGKDEERAGRKPLSIGFIGAGPVVQSKHWPAIKRLQTIWEPVSVRAFTLRTPAQAHKVETVFGGRWYTDYRQMISEERLDGVIVAARMTCTASTPARALKKAFLFSWKSPLPAPCRIHFACARFPTRAEFCS